MRIIRSFFILTLFAPVFLIAQQPPPVAKQTSIRNNTIKQHSVLAAQESDCTNGIDDDNNGLTDLDDFHCYFDENNLKGCRKLRILWASSNLGLHWFNVETNEEGYHQLNDPAIYDDLTWSSNGNFYAFDRLGGLYQINPYTFDRALMGDVGDYYHSNGMTGDANGNLYLCSFTTTLACYVVHYNVTTKETKTVFDLSEHGLISAGDLCFLNNFLYVMCSEGGDAVLAKIDIHTKSIEKIKVINTPMLGGSWGMTTLGDGYLYISSPTSEIFRLDPATGEATYFKTFAQSYMYTSGYTSYPDMCNAPCRSKVQININSAAPFCANTGVLIEAAGTGLSSDEKYTWTLPNGNTESSQSIKAVQKGDYKVLYHTSPDTCSIEANINLDIIANPSIELGNDTAICEGVAYELHPIINESVTGIVWQDGSTDNKYSINTTGKYYATASNVCHNAADTIYITHKPKPSVSLPADTVLCNYDLIEVKNLLPYNSAFKYSWSDGSAAENLAITKPGIYWLEADNSCAAEIARDTIVIAPKIDGCECFLYIPDAFTPNGDGKNDVFALRSNCNVKGSIQIFNRWGELVHSSPDLQTGWTGSRGGQLHPSGLYVYVVNYEYIRRPGNFVRKGTLHLIR